MGQRGRGWVLPERCLNAARWSPAIVWLRLSGCSSQSRLEGVAAAMRCCGAAPAAAAASIAPTPSASPGCFHRPHSFRLAGSWTCHTMLTAEHLPSPLFPAASASAPTLRCALPQCSAACRTPPPRRLWPRCPPTSRRAPKKGVGDLTHVAHVDAVGSGCALQRLCRLASLAAPCSNDPPIICEVQPSQAAIIHGPPPYTGGGPVCRLPATQRGHLR